MPLTNNGREYSQCCLGDGILSSCVIVIESNITDAAINVEIIGKLRPPRKGSCVDCTRVKPLELLVKV